MTFFRILVSLLLVAALSCTGKSAELSVQEAEALIESKGDAKSKVSLKTWRIATRPVTWKDKTGGFTVEAKYVDSTESTVTLERADGRRITVEQTTLDFNAKVRIKDIQKLASQLIAEGSAVQKRLEDEAKEEGRKAAKEKAELDRQKRHAEFLATLTPVQREVFNSAREISNAGLVREQDLVRRLEYGSGTIEAGMRAVATTGHALRLLDKLAKLHENEQMTADAVKLAVKEFGGAQTMEILESVLFGEGNENIAKILIREKPFVTRSDVYYAAGRTLHPDIRKTYGFNHVKAFERMGDKLYWDYMATQK